MIIDFPQFNSKWRSDLHRYYNCHYTYFKNVLSAGGAKINLINSDNDFKTQTAFELKIDNKRVCVDFSDHIKTIPKEQLSTFDCVFKFHYHDQYRNVKNMYPFSPVNFHDWTVFYDLVSDPKHVYNPKSDLKIMNNQRPGGAAIERRKHVQQMLIDAFDNQVDISRTSQKQYFKKVKECFISVCVPGARNNMLDRGHGQYMFFGVCTISPKLISYVSWDKPLIANEHYIECKSDYSDLIEKIEWCKTNLDECKKIGENAKQLMLTTSTPKKQIEWIQQCLT
jgi:hypothetical protein